MAIRHITTDKTTNAVTETVTHRGLVVAKFTKINVRIMSDVWADITYAVVYEPNGPVGYGADQVLEGVEKGWGKLPGMFRLITVGNSEFYSERDHVRAEVDATEAVTEIHAAYERGRVLASRMADYDRHEYDMAERRRTIENGVTVRVTKGRKVPVGTEGVVFWIGNSGYGTKVGIGLPNEDGTFDMVKKTSRYGKVYESYKNVTWTAIGNVSRIKALGGRVL